MAKKARSCVTCGCPQCHRARMARVVPSLRATAATHAAAAGRWPPATTESSPHCTTRTHLGPQKGLQVLVCDAAQDIASLEIRQTASRRGRLARRPRKRQVSLAHCFCTRATPGYLRAPQRRRSGWQAAATSGIVVNPHQCETRRGDTSCSHCRVRARYDHARKSNKHH